MRCALRLDDKVEKARERGGVLRARGLHGVRLCVSDCHDGLRAAIGQVLGCP